MALVTSGVVPDWHGLQHELHIIVPFLFLFPSVLFLPDVILFSNLDAQTHQEPQKKTHTKSLETSTQVPTHTHKLDVLPPDSSVMPVTSAAHTYVVLTNATPSYGIHTPLPQNLVYSCLILYSWSSPTHIKKPQFSLLYIPFTSATLLARTYESHDMQVE